MLQSKYLGIQYTHKRYFYWDARLCNKKLCVHVSSSSQQSKSEYERLLARGWSMDEADSRCFSLDPILILYISLLQEAGSDQRSCVARVWSGSRSCDSVTGEMTGLGLAASQSLGRAWADKLLVPPAKTINQQLDGAADSCWTPRQLTTAWGGSWQLLDGPRALLWAWARHPQSLHCQPPPARPSHARQKQFLCRVSVQSSNSLATSQSHPFQLGTSTLNFRTIILSDPNSSFDFCILNIQTRDIRPWECSDYTSWTSHSNTRLRIWKEQQARRRLFLSFYK